MARKMKDSGIEWIGEIPEGWEIRKIKNNFMIYAGATPKSEKAEYWDGGIPWITPADFKTTDKYVSYGRKSLTALGYDSCGTTLVPAGSIIFSKRAPVGSVVIAKNTLCTNQGCLACIPNDAVNSTYFYYCISIFTEQFELVSAGTTFKEIAASTFASFLLPCPPLSQQNEIVNFLNKESSRIDSMLSKTRSSIEEYKKLKQAVITQAVTKGVRGEREMKDSGVEWIGTYPSNWKIIKIKWLLHERKDRSVTGLEEPLSMSQKKGLIPTKDMDSIPNMASSFIGAKLVYNGDLVFNKLKAHLGVFSVSKYNGLVSPDYAVYYSTGLANLNFLELLFKTPQYINEFKKKSSGVGAGLTRLYTGDLYSIYCALPPLVEQEEIADYLDIKCAEIDKLIAKKEQLVKELESYKKSLIYEVVTGKREV